MDNLKKIPTGIKILSVYYYIAAAFGVLLVLLFLFGAGTIDAVIEGIPLLKILGTGLVIIVGITLLTISVLTFFIGRGLWKLKKWARIIVIIFAVLGILVAIISIFSGSILSGILNLAIEGLIGGYLLFNKEVKEVFT